MAIADMFHLDSTGIFERLEGVYLILLPNCLYAFSALVFHCYDVLVMIEMACCYGVYSVYYILVNST